MAKSKVSTITAAMEPALNRRQMLTGFVAASAATTAVSVPSAAKAEMVATPKENPELLQAYETLVAARAEHEKAKAELEWLVDEWRHRWPLAPEEILEGANAQCRHNLNYVAERDIAGRFLMRDTSDLTKRLTAKQQAEQQRTCFYLLTSTRAEQMISQWEKHIPTGRTAKSLARNTAFRDTTIRVYRDKLRIAKAYERETATLRNGSGVDAIKWRISDTKTKMERAASEISHIPAFTFEGLQIKAAVLFEVPFVRSEIEQGGVFGNMARFVQSVLNMGGRA